ncbi:MAG: TraB/GumN family protein [Clostridia bacterium]|nr:TraB/GumN family protein [Clostridia bacterium]
MIFTKRLYVLLLTLALLLGVAACDGEMEESADTSSEESVAGVSSETIESSDAESSLAESSLAESSDEESSEPPPPPEPTAADIFADAAAVWAEADNYHHEIEIVSDRIIGTIGYTEETERTVDFVGIGSDTFASMGETETILFDTVFRSAEQYVGSNAYFRFLSEEDGSLYVSEMNADNYMERALPAVILTPSLYSEVTFANEEKTEIVFSGASDAEGWLAAENVWINEASGVAYLKDGVIEIMEYSVSYTRGPVTAYEQYTVKLSKSDLTASDISAPNAENTVEIKRIDLPEILNYASFMLASSPYGSGIVRHELFSELAGVYFNEQLSLDSVMCEDNSIRMELDDQCYLQLPSDEIETSWNARCENGVITYLEDGKTVTEDAPTQEDMTNLIFDTLISVTVMIPDMMHALEITDAGDFWILEFDIDESLAKDFEQYGFSLVLSDPSIIDQFVSDFRVKSFAGKLSIDKDTGFLTASHYSIEAAHVAEGEEFGFAFVRNLFYEIGDISAYYHITENPYPDVEPPKEEKATPTFFEVTDKHGNKLYLLGTIHLGDDRTAFLPDEIYDALDASDALAVEMDLLTVSDRIEEDKELHDAYMDADFYTDGSTLRDHIPGGIYEKLCRRMFAIGYEGYADSMRPISIDSAYAQYLTESCNYLVCEKGVDVRLLTLAHAQNKKVYEIEDVKAHLLTMNGLSDETVRVLLKTNMRYQRTHYLADELWAYELWCSGDVDTWNEYLNTEFSGKLTPEQVKAYEEYERVLASDRDLIMFDGIKEYLASGETVFVAVGMAHVLGDGALVDMLTEAGYTVTLVEYEQ